jgi:hypothetical protein
VANDATLFQLVPIGEENAVPARWIWQAHGRLWTVATIKNRLNSLVKAGQIECSPSARRGNLIGTSVYFRKPALPFIETECP